MARFNFKGWDFKIWLLKNKELIVANKNNIKLIVSGLSGILSAYFSGLSVSLGAPLALIITTVSKLILDSFDYWISK